MSLPESFQRGASTKDMILKGSPQIFLYGFLFGVGHYFGFLLLKLFFSDIKYLAIKTERQKYKSNPANPSQKPTRLLFQENGKAASVLQEATKKTDFVKL